VDPAARGTQIAPFGAASAACRTTAIGTHIGGFARGRSTLDSHIP
jgi:hypothetical protein